MPGLRDDAGGTWGDGDIVGERRFRVCKPMVRPSVVGCQRVGRGTRGIWQTLEITLVGPTVAFSDARAFAVGWRRLRSVAR